ncbi:MAG: uracil-DNA glycosylase [Acidimicrobiia bacterium]
MPRDLLARLDTEISACRACPRLVAWREAAAADPPARYRGEQYWARPVPGFGPAAARLVVVGLAPAANGANRTGRMFTGDRSGDWLYRALYRAGFANQPTSTDRNDGLSLRDARITAAVRCAPPDNKPSTEERVQCAPYLAREFALLSHARVVVALGAFAYEAVWRMLAADGVALPKPRPKFTHGLEVNAGEYVVLGSYHPSQQNTFTGKLTEAMLDAVFARAAALVNE